MPSFEDFLHNQIVRITAVVGLGPEQQAIVQPYWLLWPAAALQTGLSKDDIGREKGGGGRCGNRSASSSFTPPRPPALRACFVVTAWICYATPCRTVFATVFVLRSSSADFRHAAMLLVLLLM